MNGKKDRKMHLEYSMSSSVVFRYVVHEKCEMAGESRAEDIRKRD